MQVAFFLAGEITQVKETIPWVRCASGNVWEKRLGSVELHQKKVFLGISKDSINGSDGQVDMVWVALNCLIIVNFDLTERNFSILLEEKLLHGKIVQFIIIGFLSYGYW